MVSKTILKISLVVFVVSVVYKIPKTAAKLSMGMYSGATPDLLPFGVIEQIQMRNPLKSVQSIAVEKSVMLPPTPYQDPRSKMFNQNRRTSIKFRRHNYINRKSRPSTLRKQSLLALSQQNKQSFHLYNHEGEHMLDLKVDKTEHRPSDGPKRSTNRRKTVLYPKQSNEGLKQIHHYWLYV